VLARVYPFHAYRYTAKAGAPANLLTQPYDKISPEMQMRYLSLSPYNLVRIILGQRKAGDSGHDNVYTRAAGHLESWIADGLLAREELPGLYPYFQEFTLPDSGERLTRKGFIALGAVEDYSAGVVHRHEQTLSGPKKDRMELLRHTHAHFGQIFMLYPDPAREIDRLLDEAAYGKPLVEVTDEYGAIHRLWKLADAQGIQQLMTDKKLLIADGHHRYETALAFCSQNPALPGADRAMMTFVNMHSPGLTILATHRLVSGLPAQQFRPGEFLLKTAGDFQVSPIDSVARLQQAWRESAGNSIIGAVLGGQLFVLAAREGRGELDVRVLHEHILDKLLGIGEKAVREEQYLRYVRGLDTAIQEARSGAAQIAFLLQPVSIEQVAKISFSGGVMPQKSTDFYPKLLSGLTIYRLE
jgi:uncharacterized protein (DUF1015 family)